MWCCAGVRAGSRGPVSLDGRAASSDISDARPPPAPPPPPPYEGAARSSEPRPVSRRHSCARASDRSRVLDVARRSSPIRSRARDLQGESRGAVGGDLVNRLRCRGSGLVLATAPLSLRCSHRFSRGRTARTCARRRCNGPPGRMVQPHGRTARGRRTARGASPSVVPADEGATELNLPAHAPRCAAQPGVGAQPTDHRRTDGEVRT
jgi:hypothetical protein